MNKTALILVNIGTPDSPEKKDVRKYLFQFLNDKRVINIPTILRFLLVNLIIVPFRTPKSSKIYKKLWTSNGSPIIYYSNNLVNKISNIAGDKYDVFAAMRYGNPSLKNVLNEIKVKNYDKIILFPMFPQYASSTTGSLAEFAMKEISKWNVMPELRIISQFYDNEHFINAFASRVKDIKLNEYDHIVFSYHGLPVSQIDEIHPEVIENKCNCVNDMPAHGRFCYKATCYETTRLLAGKLNISKENYSVSFQSRLTKNWLKPFTDELLLKLLMGGKKKILVFAPAFVTDCLETLIEIGDEYKEMFLEKGGEKLSLVPSLNDSDEWAEAILKIIE